MWGSVHYLECDHVSLRQELDREMKELQHIIRESERGQSMSVHHPPALSHALGPLFRGGSPAISGGQSCGSY